MIFQDPPFQVPCHLVGGYTSLDAFQRNMVQTRTRASGSFVASPRQATTASPGSAELKTETETEGEGKPTKGPFAVELNAGDPPGW